MSPLLIVLFIVFIGILFTIPLLIRPPSRKDSSGSPGSSDSKRYGKAGAPSSGKRIPDPPPAGNDKKNPRRPEDPVDPRKLTGEERDRMLEEMKALARENPQRVAGAVRKWIKED